MEGIIILENKWFLFVAHGYLDCGSTLLGLGIGVICCGICSGVCLGMLIMAGLVRKVWKQSYGRNDSGDGDKVELYVYWLNCLNTIFVCKNQCSGTDCP